MEVFTFSYTPLPAVSLKTEMTRVHSFRMTYTKSFKLSFSDLKIYYLHDRTKCASFLATNNEPHRMTYTYFSKQVLVVTPPITNGTFP